MRQLTDRRRLLVHNPQDTSRSIRGHRFPGVSIRFAPDVWTRTTWPPSWLDMMRDNPGLKGSRLCYR